MPFTLVHPVAIVPLARRPFIFSALVVGSLSPDFEYVIHLASISWISHTLPGLFVFCLPAGLIVLWLWHALLKNAVVELLPDAHYRRLLPLCRPFRFFPAARLALIAASILVGGFTHIAWDSFTHYYGWGVQHLAALSTPVFGTGHGSLKLYNVLQHGSTLAGLLLLAVLYAWWFRRARMERDNATPPLSPSARLWTVASMLAGAGFMALVYAWASAPPSEGLRSLIRFVGTFVLVGMCALWAELIGFSLWHRLSRRARQERKGPGQPVPGGQ